MSTLLCFSFSRSVHCVIVTIYLFKKLFAHESGARENMAGELRNKKAGGEFENTTEKKTVKLVHSSLY